MPSTGATSSGLRSRVSETLPRAWTEIAAPVTVDLDHHDDDGEEQAGGEQGRDDDRRQALPAEEGEAERYAEEPRIGIAGGEPLDAGIGQALAATPLEGEGKPEGDQHAAAEGQEEMEIGELASGEGRHRLEEQRRQGEIDDEAVDAVGGRRAQDLEARREIARQDQSEDRERGVDDGFHAGRSTAFQVR